MARAKTQEERKARKERNGLFSYNFTLNKEKDKELIEFLEEQGGITATVKQALKLMKEHQAGKVTIEQEKITDMFSAMTDFFKNNVGGQNFNAVQQTPEPQVRPQGQPEATSTPQEPQETPKPVLTEQDKKKVENGKSRAMANLNARFQKK